MNFVDFTFADANRARHVPARIYTPANASGILPVVIFNPGYQEQSVLKKAGTKLACKNFEYLAKFFTDKNYAFISIQHDILGDKDGLETLDVLTPPSIARQHLWARAEENINFVINELKKRYPNFNLNKFIVVGHSNGGDIAKYFANNNEIKVSHVISLDGRRCPIEPFKRLKVLMFEATDTSTDYGVIPDEGTAKNPKRINLELMMIKPKGAMHMSYCDDGLTDEVKESVFRGINFFLDT